MSKQIDEIRARAEKGLKSAEKLEKIILAPIQVRIDQAIDCEESIKDIPKLCDALDYARGIIHATSFQPRLHDTKIDQILKGKNGKD